MSMENLQHKDLLKARRIKYGLYCDFVLIGRHCEHYLIKLRSRFSLCWNSLLMYSMTSNRNCWVNHSMLIRPANQYIQISFGSPFLYPPWLKEMSTILLYVLGTVHCLVEIWIENHCVCLWTFRIFYMYID